MLVATARKQVQEVEALLQVETHRLADVEEEDSALAVDRAEAELAVAEARVRQSRSALGECVLRAPGPGVVVETLVGPGDVVGGPAGSPAVRYAAGTGRMVRVELEQEFAGRVRVGSKATVSEEEGGGGWGGRVSRVGEWYRRRWSLAEGPGLSTDVRTVECWITLAGSPRLRLGQRVQVRIEGE